MDIAFHIPEWLLWVIGIPAGLVLLGLAGLGVVYIRFMGDLLNNGRY